MSSARCAAVLAFQHRHQQPWLQCCQQRAVATVEGVPLCGTHVNAVHDREIKVVVPMYVKEDMT